MLIQLCASLAGAAGVTAYAHRTTMTRQVLAATGANIIACGMLVAAHQIRLPADPVMVPKFGSGVLPILFVSALGLGVAALPGCAVGLVWSALLRLLNPRSRQIGDRSNQFARLKP